MSVRDLATVDRRLKDYKLVCRYRFRRFENPAYWFDLYTKNFTHYYVAKQWSFFRKDSDKVEGHQLSGPFVNGDEVYTYLTTEGERKIEASWKYLSCHIMSTISDVDLTMREAITNVGEFYSQKSGILFEDPFKQKEKPKVPSVTFKTQQLKRKKRAQW